MPPLPLEGACTDVAVQNFMPTDGNRNGSISLGMLIEFIVQRTYHDLTVLAELLPRKTDLERKVEIYNFSARTRQLFIRLLALVKWASSASKVDKCSHIMSFLDKQSMLFVETADMLARIARETLVHARLPNFHIPAAVEVLTTGTYNRLPACIKEKIVPADAITAVEKKQTLNRLNQVIQHRLVTGNLIPQMRKFKIENGRVTFHVDYEFEVSLTVMGDGPMIPWRLLDIEILVEDRQTGDGKPLVHPMQVNYIHQLIQARLVDNVNALAEVYRCLHYFCQSLQLEVLYTQTLRLCRDRLDDHIHVDDYMPGAKLTVSYWRELCNRDPKPELGYKLTVQTDPTDTAKPLAVLHVPSLGNKDSEVADRAVRSDMLSMERLLVHTVYVRSYARLNDLKSEFQLFMKDVDYHLQGTPAILTIPVLNPCLRAEQIHITVDTHTGMLHCHVPKHLDCPLMAEMQVALNSDTSRLQHFVSELRFWITKRRCEKTLQHLPATLQEKLPLIFDAGHPIKAIGKHKIFIQLHRHPNYVLIVELKEKPKTINEMEYFFYLLNVASSFGESQEKSTDQSLPEEHPKMFLKVLSMVEFDTFVVTHGPGTFVDESTSNKRKSSIVDSSAPTPKAAKTIYPAYFVSELAHVVAMCDEKLPFVALGQELVRRDIPHCGIQVEANATSLVMKLLRLPQPVSPGAEQRVNPAPVIDKVVWNSLMRRILSISVRAQVNKNNQTRLWTLEIVFHSTPIQSSHHKEQSPRRPIYLQYEMLPTTQIAKTVDAMLNDWSKVVYLYALVFDYAEMFKMEKYGLVNMATVRSYSYTSLLLAYGPTKEIQVNIFWCVESKEFKLMFTGGNSALNAHSMMRDQLQAYLNRSHNLAQIVYILHETYAPLSSIAKLPILPQLGVVSSNPKIPCLSFAILPQSPTLLRLSYQGTYCLEVRCKGSGLVSIRDGAYSRFDRSNVVEEFTPTQGLKGFLSKYVDENAVYRRRSQSEDDNPPSPIAMEETQGGPGSVGSSSFLTTGLRGPQSPREPGLRFAPPLTPPSGSNPHTPASPHPQQQQTPSLSGFASMTSPPAPHLPHPSPSGMMPNSPLNPQPSPLAAHSPGPSALSYMQSHTEGSPFPVLSPAASNWPGSPGMPRPSPRAGQSPDHNRPQQVPHTPHLSRVLPANRSWAGAVPTLLTHEALDTLCRPSVHPQRELSNVEMSPLERFLGCVFMRRQLQRLIQSEDGLAAITPNEPGVVLFKVDGLQCQVFLNPIHMQSLHLKVTQTPSPNMPPWQPDDLQILEQFFELRVASPPYRPQQLCSFTRMLILPSPVIKDFIQIMRLEIFPPELSQGYKWAVQFCLRVPPSAPAFFNVGQASVVYRMRVLFFLQLTRIPYLPGQDWKNAMTVLLPMVYDPASNITQLAERREPAQPITINAASMQLRRFATEFQPQHGAECSIFPAVRDLMMNLVLQNEPPPPPQMQGQMVPMQSQMQSPMGQQMVQSPMQPGQMTPGQIQQMQNQVAQQQAAMANSSPNPAMMQHSPMPPPQL